MPVIEEISNSAEGESRWQSILQDALQRADSVEFNVLYRDKELKRIKSRFAKSIEANPNPQRYYPNNEQIRLMLDSDVKQFILSKSYYDWVNYCLEDMSFYEGNREFLATITHEGYVVSDLLL